MLQICMSDCVLKFGRLNKRALMKSWSLLLLSDSKLLELLSLVSPHLLCSSLICCNRRKSQIWPIWEHPLQPPWTCCLTPSDPSDHLWCPINHPRPVDSMHPPLTPRACLTCPSTPWDKYSSSICPSGDQSSMMGPHQNRS